MTPQERALPKVIDGSRRQRIAQGSGTTVEEVNRLLEGRKEMEKMMKGMSKGKVPQLPGARRRGTAGSPTQGDEVQQTQEAIEDTEVISWRYE